MSGRTTTEDRLARLLAMIPWIAAHEGPAVADVCARFNLTPTELAADIQLLYVCGLHPYTPDLLIEADIRQGRVWVSYADYFSRPLRMTPVEGLGLLTAAQALLAVPGTDPAGPLATGLAKLAASLGVDDAIHVEFGSTDESVLDTLRSARDNRQQVEIDYLTLARDERSLRTIEPAHVHVTQGQWYVSGWCHQAGAERNFRVDRIARATALDAAWTHPPTPTTPELFADAARGGTVTVRLAAEDRWVAEQYPVEERRELASGEIEVVLPVTDHAWLDRLALRLSPRSSILESPISWPGAHSVATRVLQRYHDVMTQAE
jgi:predicted DNA-binding transcriptional regulator YafY